MKSMVNEALKQRLKAKIEQLVKDASKDPSSLDQALPTASSELTAEAKVDVPPNVQHEYNRELAKLRHEITEVQRHIANPSSSCAVKRRWFTVGESPTRELVRSTG